MEDPLTADLVLLIKKFDPTCIPPFDEVATIGVVASKGRRRFLFGYSVLLIRVTLQIWGKGTERVDRGHCKVAVACCFADSAEGYGEGGWPQIVGRSGGSGSGVLPADKLIKSTSACLVLQCRPRILL